MLRTKRSARLKATVAWGGDGGVREGMHDGAKKGVVPGILTGADGELRHAEATMVPCLSQDALSGTIKSNLCLIQEVVKHAISPLLGTRRRHRKAPLRGARVR